MKLVDILFHSVFSTQLLSTSLYLVYWLRPRLGPLGSLLAAAHGSATGENVQAQLVARHAGKKLQSPMPLPGSWRYRKTRFLPPENPWESPTIINQQGFWTRNPMDKPVRWRKLQFHVLTDPFPILFCLLRPIPQKQCNASVIVLIWSGYIEAH